MIEKNVKQLVARTANIFPWYKDKLEETKADCGVLQTLPFIDQAVLLKHYYNSEPLHPSWSKSYFTSGTSSGKRKRIFWSDRDQNIYVGQRKSIIQAFSGENFSRACADLGTGHAAASAGEIFRAMGCDTELIDFTRPLDEHIVALNRFQPEILFTMPMILDRLIGSGELKIQPQRILVVGDVATISWQKKVAKYFDIPHKHILDLYGSIEIGSIAFYNHSLGCYQFDPWILPEVLSPQAIYSDVSWKNDSGILVLTSFAREAFPAIRFVTNDLLVGFAVREVNGEKIYTYDRCIGRYSSEYKHGERICLNDIGDAIIKHYPFANFDLNDSQGGLRIRIAVDSLPQETINLIKSDLLSKNPDVAQMISSGLVGDIAIQRADSHSIATNKCKRRY